MELLSLFNPSLMEARLSAKDSEEAIRKLGRLLIEQKKVSKEYIEEVSRREREYPTGLRMPGVKVAMPHAGAANVFESALAVGVLEKPILFGMMGYPNQTTEVDVVFLLAIHEKTGQVIALQQLVQLFQADEVLKKVVACTTSSELYEVILNGIQEMKLETE